MDAEAQLARRWQNQTRPAFKNGVHLCPATLHTPMLRFPVSELLFVEQRRHTRTMCSLSLAAVCALWCCLFGFSAGVAAETYPQTTCYNPFGTAGNDTSRAVGNTTTCYAMAENESISTASLGVYHFGSFYGNASLYLDVVRETARRALPLYAGLLGASLPLNLRVHVVRFPSQEGDAPFAASWTRDEHADTCYVEIQTVGYSYSPAQNLLREGSKLAFQNALAFQFYRCVQLRAGLYRTAEHFNATKEFSRWWFDGSAEYFSSVFYPTKDSFSPERSFTLNSLAGLLLSDQPSGSTTASYFFLHLSNVGWTDAEIHAWVVAQRFAVDGVAELTRMASDAQLVEAYPTLVERFIDELTTFRDGSPVRSLFKKNFWEFSSQYIDTKVREEGLVDISISSYAFETSLLPRLHLMPGQVFAVTFQHNPWLTIKGEDMFVKWKRDNETSWQRLDYNQTIQVWGEEWGSGQNTTYDFLPLMTKPIIEKNSELFLWLGEYTVAPENALLRVTDRIVARSLRT